MRRLEFHNLKDARNIGLTSLALALVALIAWVAAFGAITAATGVMAAMLVPVALAFLTGKEQPR